MSERLPVSLVKFSTVPEWRKRKPKSASTKAPRKRKSDEIFTSEKGIVEIFEYFKMIVEFYGFEDGLREAIMQTSPIEGYSPREYCEMENRLREYIFSGHSARTINKHTLRLHPARVRRGWNENGAIPRKESKNKSRKRKRYGRK